MQFKRWFYFLIHLNFIIGFAYAFYHFINTPRSVFLHRRLWAYESWIIVSFYALFIFLILFEQEKLRGVKAKIKRFQSILAVNLLLLIFPWGLFLLTSPDYLMEVFGFNSICWRLLGMSSLFSAAIYYFPYRFKGKKISRWILAFGWASNLVTALALALLFAFERVPLIAFSSTPLLFYFAYFFWEQSRQVES